MAMQFKETIALPSHLQIYACSKFNISNSEVAEILKTLNILVIYPSVNFANTLCSQVSENNFWILHCNLPVSGEKLLV